MKVLVLSDSHDQKTALKAALKQGKKQGCEVVFFCGDSSSPSTFSILVEDGRPLYVVLGNIEHGRKAIKKLAREANHVIFDPYVLVFTINEKKIGIIHYPDGAETLAEKGRVNAVFHGHTHEPRIEYRGRVLIGNPGEISGHITGKRSFGIYDTQTNNFRVVPLKLEK